MVNLKCVICNKEFEDAATVKTHITTHLSGLPFVCYKCEYSFENEEDLYEHQQKHLGESESGSDNENFETEIDSELKDDNPQPRRSQRDRKVKNFADFLKDEDFSESDSSSEICEDEYMVTKSPLFQPVVRSETMRVYKGVRDKKPEMKLDSEKTQELTQKVVEAMPKENKSVTKITTLENLGLSKSTLEAITEKSGFVEMKIGQKVIRVQKLMMSKAEVQAMADQGNFLRCF